MQKETSTDAAKDYYDSAAHEIYKECWGGENHHLGLFNETNDFKEAAQKANENLYSKLEIKKGDKILDMGSGFCGLPRFIVSKADCKVTALNISEKENEYARRKNQEVGLDDKIEVIEGDFNNMPFEDNTFDIVISQESMLHSPDKGALLKESARVLKNNGQFIFSDILKMPSLTSEEAEMIYQRIKVPHLATFDFYKEKLKETGFEVKEVVDLESANLGLSYKSVYENIQNKKDELINEKNIPEDMIDRTLNHLQFWVEKAFENKIGWGLFVARLIK